MGLLPRFRDCFFCSPDGEGLKMQMQIEDETVFATFTLDHKFQGYSNIAHAGIVTGILDETMWWTVFIKTRQLWMTRKMEIELLRPVFCSHAYRVEGRFIGQHDGNVDVSAAIQDLDGRVAARTTGLFRLGRNIPRDAFIEKLDFLDVSSEIREMLLAALQ